MKFFNKKRLIITITITAIITISVLFILSHNKSIKTKEIADIYKNINIFTDRGILKKSSNIYIGNNLKELENGYYDILIQDNDFNIFTIVINSLSKKKVQIIEEEYISELTNYIEKTLNQKIDINKLKKNIIEIYTKLRSDLMQVEENIEYVDNSLRIKVYTKSYELYIEIGENVV